MSQQTEKLFPGKFFISTVLETLDTKQRMSGDLLRVYLQRAAMAGVVIGIFYTTNFTMIATFAQVGDGTFTLEPLGKIAGALVFGFALAFIYYTKSELLTSSMMIVSVGAYYRTIGWVKAMRLMFYCYVGNLIGGLFVALLLLGSSITDGAVLDQMTASVDHKLEYVTGGLAGWSDLFVRAILCNFMINLSLLLVYNGLIKEDLTKILVMVVAVFVFAFLGFEHSVANTVLFGIVGLEGGVAFLPAAGNVLVALAGNFVGGGLLIGLYYAYVNDDARYMRQHLDEVDS